MVPKVRTRCRKPSLTAKNAQIAKKCYADRIGGVGVQACKRQILNAETQRTRRVRRETTVDFPLWAGFASSWPISGPRHLRHGLHLLPASNKITFEELRRLTAKERKDRIRSSRKNCSVTIPAARHRIVGERVLEGFRHCALCGLHCIQFPAVGRFLDLTTRIDRRSPNYSTTSWPIP